MPAMPCDAVLFDLDNTLYPSSSGLFDLIDARIHRFLEERLGLAPEEATARRRRYRATYGITLAGLMAEEKTDPGDYLRWVHDVPVEELLAPDPALGRLLGELPCASHVFTNGSTAHAERVLARLGVRRHVGRVFGIESTGYRPKPEAAAFLQVLEELGLDAGRVVYVDDLPENLDAARRLGMTTVLVGPSSADGHRRAAGTAGLATILLELTAR